MHPRSAVSAAVVAALVACGASCKRGDEFSEAPTARAPEEPLVAQGASRKAEQDRSRGQVPPGHPPVGGEMESSSGSSGDGAKAGGSNAGGALPVDWETPSSWEKVRPSSQMRKAQYRIPGVEGASDATLAVFFFPSGGGSIQKNIARWSRQFGTDGKAAEPKTDERTIEGLTVHTVELSGTYSPGVGMGAGEPKKKQKMLGAIVETGSGAAVFKMVGPAPTVRENADGFEQLVSSLNPDG